MSPLCLKLLLAGLVAVASSMGQVQIRAALSGIVIDDSGDVRDLVIGVAGAVLVAWWAAGLLRGPGNRSRPAAMRRSSPYAPMSRGRRSTTNPSFLTQPDLAPDRRSPGAGRRVTQPIGPRPIPYTCCTAP